MFRKSLQNPIRLMASEYSRAIKNLNALQSNTQTIALAKYKKPEQILPLFAKQLQAAGIKLSDLDKLNIIHISGTKGKGSTCAFIESILRKAGETTGFYNSPHLIKVTERIRINGSPIDDLKFTNYFEQIYDRLIIETQRQDLTMPSYFSFLTILSFHIFIQEKVDCAIVEVGIGGEYDPTNIIQRPIACGISTLDFDHTNILGKTIDSIAWSKAGIAKKNVPLFTINQQYESALDVLESRAREKGSPFYICQPINAQSQSNLILGIQGSAQYSNAALACHISKYFLEKVRGMKSSEVSVDAKKTALIETNLNKFPSYFSQAMKSCSWPGRCQIIDYKKLTFFLDGAHTKKSMENCLDWFLKASENNDSSSRKVLMINIIGERDKSEVLQPIAVHNYFHQIIFSSNRIHSSSGDADLKFDNTSMISPHDKSIDNVMKNIETWKSLTKEFMDQSIFLKRNITDAITHLDELSQSTDHKYHVLVTGSLHFVGALLEFFTLNQKGKKSGS